MGLLGRTILLSLAAASSACYEPTLRDCTLACSTSDDCADGQICGTDRFCAAPGVAGQCGSHARDDAGVTGGGGSGSPATPVDASVDAPPDAPTHGLLTLSIDGHGKVIAAGVGSCDYTAQPCELRVPLDTAVQLTAVESDEEWRFDAWSAGPCATSGNMACSFPPSYVMVASAKFKKADR